jgi:predicted amidohydrolase
VPGPSTDHFCRLAKELRIYLTIPLLECVSQSLPGTEEDDRELEQKGTPRYFNTVCLANPAGELVAHYRKLNPWPYPEKSWATAGDRGLQVCDTEYGRVGLAICFDIHTILEDYESEHLWALLYPIAWVDEVHPADWFWHQLPARVGRFKHYVIGANWSVDRQERWRGYGFSTIISPQGNVVATAKSLYGSEIVRAEVQCQKQNYTARNSTTKTRAAPSAP